MKAQGHMRLLSITDDGVSEMVAALLLTAIVTIGIGVIAVSVLSNPSPSEIPSLNAELAKREVNVVLVHDGGDILFRETTRIMVDGVDRTDDFKTPDGDDWSTFSTGDLLESSILLTEDTQVMIVYTGSESPSVILTLGRQPGPPPPFANFTTTPASAYISQLFLYLDLSTGSPDFWYWELGDFTNSTQRIPTHRYSNPGTYEVTLTACNEGGCNSTKKSVTVFDFSDFVTNESVFVYGTKLEFDGREVIGEGSTIIITGGISSGDLHSFSEISVSNIYINGSVYLTNFQVVLGSEDLPELVYITGGLEMDGSTELYGNEIYVDGETDLSTNAFNGIHGNFYVNDSLDFNSGYIIGETHVKGNLYLDSVYVRDNIYVDGDLIFDGYPTIDSDAHIYYTGSTNRPSYYRCSYAETVPDFLMPAFLEIPIPDPKSDDWYSSKGYVSGGDLLDVDLTNGIKIYSQSDFSISQEPYYTQSDYGKNIVIVSKEGNIYLNDFTNVPVTGVIFAPNGEVYFDGKDFEGVVISKNGFIVPDDSSYVIFKNIENYITDPEDYPF